MHCRSVLGIEASNSSGCVGIQYRVVKRQKPTVEIPDHNVGLQITLAHTAPTIS